MAFRAIQPFQYASSLRINDPDAETEIEPAHYISSQTLLRILTPKNFESCFLVSTLNSRKTRFLNLMPPILMLTYSSMIHLFM